MPPTLCSQCQVLAPHPLPQLTECCSNEFPSRKLEAARLPPPLTPFCCLGGAKLSRGCWQPSLGRAEDLGASDPSCKWFLLGSKNLETDHSNNLGKETEKGDTFRCPNMLLRKSLKSHTHPQARTQVQAVHDPSRCSGASIYSGSTQPITTAIPESGPVEEPGLWVLLFESGVRAEDVIVSENQK